MLEICLKKGRKEAGCDEAGRGCLAGPVFAAAVILPDDFYHPLLNDSKKMTENDRKTLRPIIEAEAVAWAVAQKNIEEIDRLNILWASMAAVHAALDGLAIEPGFILMDGNRFPKYKNIPHQSIIKGDGKYANIAAASVLAKTHRDEWMERLDKAFPGYGWASNKGYPTIAHRAAIEKLGVTTHHRRSFKLLAEGKTLFDADDGA